MDPVQIVTQVLSLASKLIQWTEERKAKAQVFRDLHATLDNVHRNILQPLSDPSISAKLRPNVVGALQQTHEVLIRTQEDLDGYEDSGKKGMNLAKVWIFFNPKVVTEDLKSDETSVINCVTILDGALKIAELLDKPSASTNMRSSPSTNTTLLAFNKDVKDFWEKEIGNQVSSCSPQTICLSLQRYFKRKLVKDAERKMSLRVDEYGVGSVTVFGLNRFVGDKSLLESIEELGLFQNQGKFGPRRVRSNPDIGSIQPILLLVDDEPNHLQPFIDLVKSLNINVSVVTSTASAKSWVESNEALLRAADSLGKFRCVSDTSRWEHSDKDNKPSRNHSAGEMILRFLRGRQYKCPLLIFAEKGIKWTQYVRKYSDAGSTTYQDVMNGFVLPLLGNSDDEWWKDMNVFPKHGVKPMLIWVGHAPDPSLTAFSNELGIQTITISAPVATTWIHANEALVRRMDNAHLLRFIFSSTTVFDTAISPAAVGGGPCKGLLQLLRSEGYRAPWALDIN